MNRWSVFAFLFFWGVKLAVAAPTQWVKGVDSSGGAKSVVCRAANSTLISVELLDLYEARTMYGLKLLDMGADLDVVMEKAKDRVSSANRWWGKNVFYPQAVKIKNTLRILPPQTKLEPVDDAVPAVKEEGCALEQSAVYVDEKLVVVDQEHWNAMDARNRGALIAHEEIYYRMRMDEKDENSRRARKLVGHLFSDFSFEEVSAGIPRGVWINICWSKDDRKDAAAFWVYPNEKSEAVMQFTDLRGRMVFGKTTASSPGLKWPLGEELQSGVSIPFELASNFEAGREFYISRQSGTSPSDGTSGLSIALDGRRSEVPLFCIKARIISEPADPMGSLFGGQISF
jgi:hypothetical protein